MGEEIGQGVGLSTDAFAAQIAAVSLQDQAARLTTTRAKS
jgi:hypothetical protein